MTAIDSAEVLAYPRGDRSQCYFMRVFYELRHANRFF